MKHRLAAPPLAATATAFAQPAPDVAALSRRCPISTAARPVQAGADAVQRRRAERARAADDRPAGRSPAASSRACTGARAIPTGWRSTTRSRATTTPRAQQRAALPDDQRQPLGSASTRTVRSSARRRCRPATRSIPPDLTRAQIERYVASHPGRRRRDLQPVHRGAPAGRRSWSGRPYHDEFKRVRDRRRRGAAAGRRALAPIAAFARFLRLRADALLTDDYYASDIAWLELKNPKFDVIFAPYETYLDDLLGVKTSYGAAVLIRNEPESRNLAEYQQWVPDIQDALPLAGGGPAVGARPRDADGSDGRAVPRRRPAARLPGGGGQPAERSAHPPGEGHQEDLLQELHGRARQRSHPAAGGARHGCGPGAARVGRRLPGVDGDARDLSRPRAGVCAPRAARQVDIREAIGPAYSGLEEAKADVVGMFAPEVAGGRRRAAEGSARGVLRVVCRRHFPHGAVRHRRGARPRRDDGVQLPVRAGRDRRTPAARYAIDYAKMPAAIAQLAKELLEQEATGDRARAEAWFAKYDRMPPALTAALARAADVPVDVDPMFSFAEPVR